MPFLKRNIVPALDVRVRNSEQEAAWLLGARDTKRMAEAYGIPDLVQCVDAKIMQRQHCSIHVRVFVERTPFRTHSEAEKLVSCPNYHARAGLACFFSFRPCTQNAPTCLEFVDNKHGLQWQFAIVSDAWVRTSFVGFS